MTDLPAVAIWLAVILLLSLATIPVCAQWRKREANQEHNSSFAGRRLRLPGKKGCAATPAGVRRPKP
jgi:hypothetical protein